MKNIMSGMAAKLFPIDPMAKANKNLLKMDTNSYQNILSLYTK